MTLTINTINDIDKLKLFAINNPNKPLCYVYYKNNLLFKSVYYVGFTTQNCYKYLKKYYKLNNLLSILQFYKFTCLFNAYILINTIYKKYIYNVIDYSKQSLLLFN